MGWSWMDQMPLDTVAVRVAWSQDTERPRSSAMARRGTYWVPSWVRTG